MADVIRDEARWHLGYLDALRGIAVLGVIAVHSSLGLTMHALAAIPFSGQRGVQLFYIVSAFTLFLSYEHRKDEAHPTRNFFIRRFFRIAPMFYVAIALACIFAPQVAGTRTDILLSVFFVHGFVPSALMHGAAAGWSVGDEWIFYLILPLLFRSITRFSQAAWAFLVSAPVLYIATQALAHRASPNMAEFFTFLGFPVELPVFLMGIAAYFFWKEHIAVRSKSASLMLLGASVGLWVIDLPFNTATSMRRPLPVCSCCSRSRFTRGRYLSIASRFLWGASHLASICCTCMRSRSSTLRLNAPPLVKPS